MKNCTKTKGNQLPSMTGQEAGWQTKNTRPTKSPLSLIIPVLFDVPDWMPHGLNAKQISVVVSNRLFPVSKHTHIHTTDDVKVLKVPSNDNFQNVLIAEGFDSQPMVDDYNPMRYARDTWHLINE